MKKRSVVTLGSVLLLVGLLAAVLLGVTPGDDQVQANQEETSDTGAATSAALESGEQILVWTAPAHVPGEQRVSEEGQIAYITAEEGLRPLTDVLQQSGRVEPCGPIPNSPGNEHFALYMGVEAGVISSLYMISGNNPPVLVDDSFQLLTCVGGNGIFEYRAEGSQMVYLDYERQFQVDFADGQLRVLTTNDFTEAFSLDDTVAFDAHADGVDFVRFFTNQFNEADEVAIGRWDGESDREFDAFFAEENCKFTNASVANGPQGNTWVGLVQNCSGQSTWTLYRISPGDEGSRVVLTQEAGGAFGTTVQTNQLVFSPDGETLYYTLPDGFTLFTAALYAYDLAGGESTTIANGGLVMPTLATPVNAMAQRSADGRYWAFVQRAGGDENSLFVVDLDEPGSPPVTARAGSSGDTISFMEWADTVPRLGFVAGGRQGADNSFFLLDMTAEAPSPERIARGNFARWAMMAPDGEEVAITEYQIQPEGVRGPDYLNLQVLDLATTDSALLYEGGMAQDNQVVDVSFAVPLRWISQ
ncbi:MAG: TolB family protein [Anaerolineales bacterium]